LQETYGEQLLAMACMALFGASHTADHYEATLAAMRTFQDDLQVRAQLWFCCSCFLVLP
jgi:hypothetical protein